MKRIGRINYINTDVFFQNWPENDFRFELGSPRELSQAAKKGEILAAALPVVEGWEMSDEFESLGKWGIAVKDQSRSVFVLSKVPLSDLNKTTIALTNDSSTSVSLLKVLIEEKYGNKVETKRGFSDDDQARLVIGDEALKLWADDSFNWPFHADLATEWWHWRKKPFVFARWIIRKDASAKQKDLLSKALAGSVASKDKKIPLLAEEGEESLIIEAAKLQEYLKGFTYEFSKKEEEGMQAFKELHETHSETKIMVGSNT